MRRHLLALTLALSGVLGGGVLDLLRPLVAGAQESVTLTTPVTFASRTGYALDRLSLDNTAGIIHVQLIGNDGTPNSCVWSPGTTPSGRTLLTALNKANLSSAYNNNGTTGSLIQRIFHRLVVMGESATVCDAPIVGALAGFPQ